VVNFLAQRGIFLGGLGQVIHVEYAAQVVCLHVGNVHLLRKNVYVLPLDAIVVIGFEERMNRPV
jgi:hypothetical protein